LLFITRSLQSFI